VFAVSDGFVSSFAPSGAVNFQRQTECHWTLTEDLKEHDASKKSPPDDVQSFEVDTHPTLAPVQLRKGGDVGGGGCRGGV
jgi:hypothetical protein